MGGWTLPQSKWHNPFTVKQYGQQAIPLFEEYIRKSSLMNDIEELRGKRLGCWCKPNACHGDILVKILHDTRPTLNILPQPTLNILPQPTLNILPQPTLNILP